MHDDLQEDLQAVTRQMQIYFDGLYFSDPAKLAGVLHPDARYVCATEDALTNLGMDEYLPIVAARQAPAARGEPRRDSIVGIEFAGPRTAFVHAHCAVGERYFTDFLTFVKVDGAWQIISKVFHFDLEALNTNDTP
ncbi:nuclear transport factor 2 family protein [Thalassospiraceae bacterium LMO-JJ14]|nr:nuclear transport factor 2 family protein [Thalassospiraceae bacterium LMO-JJ14]